MSFSQQQQQQLQSGISAQFKNEVFVGNLSYFCEEHDLFDLFDGFAEVTHVRIVRNPENNRTLMFGFVTLSTVHEAKEMAKLLHGQLFMARKLRYVIHLSLHLSKLRLILPLSLSLSLFHFIELTYAITIMMPKPTRKPIRETKAFKSMLVSPQPSCCSMDLNSNSSFVPLSSC
jgi:RNA recognition motif-containing protein